LQVTPLSAAPQATTAAPPAVGKSGKKICCACPGESRLTALTPPPIGGSPPTDRLFTPPPRPDGAETKKLRDACVVARGEEHCAKEIEAHKVCLRADGFDIK
jgi:cytochrome c oxidase assembly protein subunit 17